MIASFERTCDTNSTLASFKGFKLTEQPPPPQVSTERMNIIAQRSFSAVSGWPFPTNNQWIKQRRISSIRNDADVIAVSRCLRLKLELEAIKGRFTPANCCSAPSAAAGLSRGALAARGCSREQAVKGLSSSSPHTSQFTHLLFEIPPP